MALINKIKREINAKLIYFGPGLSGKTTNLNHIYSKLKPEFRGKLKLMNIQNDKMLFFDFTPPGDGKMNGYNVRLHIYTIKEGGNAVPPWKMVLKGADGVVFVADSSPERMAANQESLQSLGKYLAAHGQSLADIPLVFAYNKRDRVDAVPPGPAEKAERLRDDGPDLRAPLGALQRAFGEQHAVVGQDANRDALDAREAADQRGAVARLEFVKARTVYQASDQLAHIVGLAEGLGQDAVDLLGRIQRLSFRHVLKKQLLERIDHIHERQAPGIVGIGHAVDAGHGIADGRSELGIEAADRGVGVPVLGPRIVQAEAQRVLRVGRHHVGDGGGVDLA